MRKDLLIGIAVTDGRFDSLAKASMDSLIGVLADEFQGEQDPEKDNLDIVLYSMNVQVDTDVFAHLQLSLVSVGIDKRVRILNTVLSENEYKNLMPHQHTSIDSSVYGDLLRLKAKTGSSPNPVDILKVISAKRDSNSVQAELYKTLCKDINDNTYTSKEMLYEILGQDLIYQAEDRGYYLSKVEHGCNHTIPFISHLLDKDLTEEDLELIKKKQPRFYEFFFSNLYEFVKSSGYNLAYFSDYLPQMALRYSPGYRNYLFMDNDFFHLNSRLILETLNSDKLNFVTNQGVSGELYINVDFIGVPGDMLEKYCRDAGYAITGMIESPRYKYRYGIVCNAVDFMISRRCMQEDTPFKTRGNYTPRYGVLSNEHFPYQLGGIRALMTGPREHTVHLHPIKSLNPLNLIEMKATLLAVFKDKEDASISWSVDGFNSSVVNFTRSILRELANEHGITGTLNLGIQGDVLGSIEFSGYVNESFVNTNTY